MFCKSAGNTRQRAVILILFHNIFCFSKEGTLLELLFNLYYEDHRLCITRLAAECQSVNNSSKAAVMLTMFFHGDGCREVNSKLHKL